MDGEFGRLVAEMLEAMDQRLSAARPVERAWLVRSSDGFLFAFAADAAGLTSAEVRRWSEALDSPSARLVIFAPDAVPPELRAETVRRGGMVVDGERFVELVRDLGIVSPLAPAPAAEATPERHQLPTAGVFAELLERADRWSRAGVPALSLRFYRQAAALKPDALPPRVGVLRSLLALELWDEAERAARELAQRDPTNLEAPLALAAIFGARGQGREEVAAYRRVLQENPGAGAARAGLVAALVGQRAWAEARAELEELVRAAPSDPELRCLYALALRETGEGAKGKGEMARARELGLSPERERVLAAHAGLEPTGGPQS